MLGQRTALLILGFSVTLAAPIFLGQAHSLAEVASPVFHRAWALIPLALASSIVIASGDIDLSPGGMFAFAGMSLIALSNFGFSPLTCAVSVLLVTVLIGGLQGALIAFYRVPPLILTLAMSFLLLGLSLFIQASLQYAAETQRGHLLAQASRTPSTMSRFLTQTTKSTAPEILQSLPRERQLRLFSHSAAWSLAVLAGFLIWRHFSLSVLGHLAVGFNRQSAAFVGIDVKRIRFLSFLLASILLYLSITTFMVDYLDGGWSPSTGKGFELDGIAAAVIGGTGITGGRLEPLNVALGMLLWTGLQHLSVALPFIGPTTQLISVGLLLILVASVDKQEELQ